MCTSGGTRWAPVRPGRRVVPGHGGRTGTAEHSRADRPGPVRQAYASTIRTSSSVISPSTMRNERNWKGPASSVSAVETRT